MALPLSAGHLARLDLAGDRGSFGFLSNLKVVGSLKVDPALRVLRCTAKVASQGQCRIRRHSSALRHNIVDSAGWRMQGDRQRVGA